MSRYDAQNELKILLQHLKIDEYRIDTFVNAIIDAAKDELKYEIRANFLERPKEND